MRVAFSSDSSQAIASISRWLVGSSSNIRSGPPAIKRARAARRRSPPDAVSTGRAGSNLRPAPARSTLYISLSSNPWAAKSPSVAKPERSGSCSIYPTDTPGPAITSPESGSTNPPMTFIKVDLPEPLRPTRATRSPGCATRLRPSKMGSPPKVSEISFN